MKRFPHIFISYRREDSAGWAGRVADFLIAEFGRECVFFDIESIHPGSDFVRSLKQRTAECDALLVVIGRDWLNVRDQRGGRRLDDPNDLVRMEICAALRRGVRVIPLLASDADMPEASNLPGELATLADRNAVRITDTSFRQTMASLIPVLVDEGAKRPAHALPPHAARVPEPSAARIHELFYQFTAAEVLSNVARKAASVYPWMQSHKTITLSLMLLAVLTFSPLWYYPSAISPTGTAGSGVVRISDERSAIGPIDTAAPEDLTVKCRNFYVVIDGEAPFEAQELAVQIKNNPDFGSLQLEVAEHPELASAFLELSRPLRSEFVFELKSADTGSVFLSGHIEVQDNIPVTAVDVATEVVKVLKTWPRG